MTYKRRYATRNQQKKNPWTGKKQTNSQYIRKKSFKLQTTIKPGTHRHKKDEQAKKIALITIGIIFAAAIIGHWMSTHVLESITILIILITGTIFAFLKIPRFREKIQNLIQKEFKIFSNVSDEQVKKLIAEIKSINMQEVRNEEDFEKQMYQWLSAKNHHISRQVLVKGQRRLDLVINNKIAVELKVADRAKNVQDLIGQVTIYKKEYKHIIAVILDVNKVSNMKEYVELIQNVDPENIAVVLINGNLKRYKKKEEYIMVKKSTSYN
jgi:hypothetical protein